MPAVPVVPVVPVGAPEVVSTLPELPSPTPVPPVPGPESVPTEEEVAGPSVSGPSDDEDGVALVPPVPVVLVASPVPWPPVAPELPLESQAKLKHSPSSAKAGWLRRRTRWGRVGKTCSMARFRAVDRASRQSSTRGPTSG